MKTRFSAAVAILWSLSLPAQASTGAVLIVANEDYQAISDARGAGAIVQAERLFDAAGFSVDIATDLSANALRAALSNLSQQLRSVEDERVVIPHAG